jgi:hypothetical protein
MDDFVSNPVDTIADSYSGLKAYVVKGLGNILPGPIAELVVHSALTFAGIPTSLSNFDKLQEIGLNCVTDVALEGHKNLQRYNRAATVIPLRHSSRFARGNALGKRADIGAKRNASRLHAGVSPPRLVIRLDPRSDFWLMNEN